jgi:hypothetical protein
MHRYHISYNKIQRAVRVLPDHKSAGPNFFVIGEYNIKDPSLDFEEYEADLGEKIRAALGTVGETDVSQFSIKVHDIKSGETIEVQPDPNEEEEVPTLDPRDETPVSEDITAAEAAYLNQQKRENHSQE